MQSPRGPSSLSPSTESDADIQLAPPNYSSLALPEPVATGIRVEGDVPAFTQTSPVEQLEAQAQKHDNSRSILRFRSSLCGLSSSMLNNIPEPLWTNVHWLAKVIVVIGVIIALIWPGFAIVIIFHAKRKKERQGSMGVRDEKGFASQHGVQLKRNEDQGGDHVNEELSVFTPQ
ncbi:hypothetical protein VTO42DRAFT_4710 [Malbranchea cinnamomea]